MLKVEFCGFVVLQGEIVCRSGVLKLGERNCAFIEKVLGAFVVAFDLIERYFA